MAGDVRDAHIRGVRGPTTPSFQLPTSKGGRTRPPGALCPGPCAPYNESFACPAMNVLGRTASDSPRSMLYYGISTLYVLTCLVLLLVILLQQGKGGDIASAFGGSSSQTAFGARAGATLLTRVTTVCAALFMVGALALAILGSRGPSSVLRGAQAPVSKPAATTPPAANPAAPAKTT